MRGVNWSELNAVTIVIAAIVLFSLIQGLLRGASSSARRLGLMLAEGVVTAVSLLLAWQLAGWLSPKAQQWLTELGLVIPERELSFWQQLYYTGATAVRDFPLLRFSALFLLGYAMAKAVLGWLASPLAQRLLPSTRDYSPKEAPSIGSSLLGAALGTVTGLGRALLVVAALFLFTTLFPDTQASAYIQASSLYRQGATQMIKPVAGQFLSDRLPVFTRAVEQEFTGILQRKYEVLDANIPADIAQAARQVSARGESDEEKARLLYQWVGTRVVYDWDKVKLYEDHRIWKEQTPEETFTTKKGVCIDYSRLYAVMARAAGLQVKVVTGLGYDGRGGYGPHAWNEVFLQEQQAWVPLDSTWVASGGNWFNPPNFKDTHIKDA